MVIGIFGGTFAPVHYGHITAAYAFLDKCGLDRLFIVPAAIPPHKIIDHSDNPDKRFEMVKTAFQNEERIFVSDFEIKSKTKSYTVYTLEHFKKLYNAELIFLCGADMFVTLDAWYMVEKIFELTRIAYVGRGNIKINEKAEYFIKQYNAQIIPIEMPQVDISSTELRCMIAANDDISKYIPPDVIGYIQKNQMYGAKND